MTRLIDKARYERDYLTAQLRFFCLLQSNNQFNDDRTEAYYRHDDDWYYDIGSGLYAVRFV